MAATARVSRAATRSLSILVTPTPLTLTERRSVLQVLEQHGRVDFFKLAPGYQSSFLCITRDETTAKVLVHKSPLTYSISLPSHQTADLYVADVLHPGRPKEHGDQEAERDDSADKHSFRLEIFPAPDYAHEYAMAGSPLHHSWPKEYAKQRTRTASLLSRSLPQTTAAQGLQHWFFEKGIVPRPNPKMQRLRLKSWLPSKMASQAPDDVP
ncbi:hypothetical protein CDD81_7209 [Ophiocordyceps australis]|uniref:Pal1-like protein n=1 Tax=Ophiocordyceps australis TaxID=1399860 RepID=A0A2C5Y0Y4_9HYPO|nr:hypothetical protein CDD81_7209 [Ophiocordyceps australis]